MRQLKEKKEHFKKLKARKEQLERVWSEHPEAMVQLIGGALIFGGAVITAALKVAAIDVRETETFYITDGDRNTYAIEAYPMKSLPVNG